MGRDVAKSSGAGFVQLIQVAAVAMVIGGYPHTNARESWEW